MTIFWAQNMGCPSGVAKKDLGSGSVPCLTGLRAAVRCQIKNQLRWDSALFPTCLQPSDVDCALPRAED